MNPRLYTITKTIEEEDYLYEIVESDGQTGVRCRVYVNKNDILDGIFDLYDNNKYGYHFRKFLSHRHPDTIAYKFESIVWCWPLDKFDFNIGKEMAKKRVDEKIAKKKRKIRNFVHNLEKNNLPKKYFKKLDYKQN